MTDAPVPSNNQQRLSRSRVRRGLVAIVGLGLVTAAAASGVLDNASGFASATGEIGSVAVEPERTGTVDASDVDALAFTDDESTEAAGAVDDEGVAVTGIDLLDGVPVVGGAAPGGGQATSSAAGSTGSDDGSGTADDGSDEPSNPADTAEATDSSSGGNDDPQDPGTGGDTSGGDTSGSDTTSGDTTSSPGGDQPTTTTPQTPDTPATPSQPTTTQPPTTTAPHHPVADGPANYNSNLALIRSQSVRNRNHDGSPFRSTPQAALDTSSSSPLLGSRSAYLGNPNGNPEQAFPVSAGGQFRISCEFSHFAYDDPLVAPNDPGAAHLHMFFGNTDVNAYSTFSSLRDTGSSTCNGQELNRTGYWVPAMIDGDGNARIPERIVVYYKG